MAWANVNGTYEAYDMDSANPGTNQDKKLVVRNKEATASGAHRTEILQTTGNYQALKVQGRTLLSHSASQEPALVVEGTAKALEVQGGTCISHSHYHEPALVVEGTTPEEDPVDRVHIEEMSYDQNALRVNGLTYLQRKDDEHQNLAIALTVKGKMNVGPWSVPQGQPAPRPQPILVAQGRTELEAYPDEEGEDPEYALAVTGRASFRHQEDDIMAVKVDGHLALKLGEETGDEHICGMLRPVLSDPDLGLQRTLKINADPEDRPNPNNDVPHLRLGWHLHEDSTLRGNVVKIDPRVLLLGPDATYINAIYPIVMKGPVDIEEDTEVRASLRVRGKTWTEHLDATDENNVLRIAHDNATQLHLGPVGAAGSIAISMKGTTSIEGPLQVMHTPPSSPAGISATGNISAGLDINAGGNIAANGTISSQSDITAQGNITAQGIASTVTAPRIVGTGTVISEGSVECLGVASLKPEGCFHYVPASVRSDRGDVSTLAVEHLREENRDAALHVVNNSRLAEGTGGFFRANRAIVAEGEVQINGRTVLNGEAVHANPVLMQSQPIIMGGEGESEVKMICGDKRLEFYIGGKMTFYIDKSGGHNA